MGQVNTRPEAIDRLTYPDGDNRHQRGSTDKNSQFHHYLLRLILGNYIAREA